MFQNSDVDNQILLRWKNGDQKAFEEFYRKYSISLLEIANKKTNDFESAQEIIQDVFLAFYNSKDRIGNNPDLYLKGILKHKIFDYARKGKIKIMPLDEYGHTYSESVANYMYDDIYAKELDEKIKTTIDKLPGQCRTVFLMSRIENLTYPEIAAQLGISVKTVEVHIGKALKYLREHLDYQLLCLLVLSCWIK